MDYGFICLRRQYHVVHLFRCKNGWQMTFRAKQLEEAVRRTLTLLNMNFMRVDNYRCFRCGQVQNSKATGFPDFFVYSPWIFAVECKTGSGRMTKEQAEIAVKLTRQGIDYIVVRDSIDALLSYLKKRGITF